LQNNGNVCAVSNRYGFVSAVGRFQVMKELVEVLAQALVDHPEAVVVTETEKADEIILELKVDPEDMGKVIGKQGRIAKAIRAMVKAAASRTDKKVVVEIGH
jgi:predicted RNA-binding protein YlqC (UPF0109 family)